MDTVDAKKMTLEEHEKALREFTRFYWEQPLDYHLTDAILLNIAWMVWRIWRLLEERK